MFTRIRMTQEDYDRINKSNHAQAGELAVSLVAGSVKYFREHPNYVPPKREPAPPKVK